MTAILERRDADTRALLADKMVDDAIAREGANDVDTRAPPLPGEPLEERTMIEKFESPRPESLKGPERD